MTECLVELTVQKNIAFLAINRPKALNAINREVLFSLQKQVATLSQKTDVHVVVVCGTGEKAFVAGADIKELQELSPESAAKLSSFGSEVFFALEKLPQLTIARVQGFALGGGLELALACDLIVASEEASFGLPETSLGLIPGFSGTQRLARRIGAAKTLEWIATAQKYNAQEAFASGLVDHVVPSTQLLSFTDSLCTRILKNSPQALRAAKRAVKYGEQFGSVSGSKIESSEFGLRFRCDEAKEGLTAFVEKRPPRFLKD